MLYSFKVSSQLGSIPFSLPDEASGRNVVEIVFVLPVFVLKYHDQGRISIPPKIDEFRVVLFGNPMPFTFLLVVNEYHISVEHVLVGYQGENTGLVC